jgi:hypothetical protein
VKDDSNGSYSLEGGLGAGIQAFMVKLFAGIAAGCGTREPIVRGRVAVILALLSHLVGVAGPAEGTNSHRSLSGGRLTLPRVARTLSSEPHQPAGQELMEKGILVTIPGQPGAVLLHHQRVN